MKENDILTDKKSNDINFNIEQEIITKPLLALKEKLKNKQAKQISKEIYNFLEEQIDKEKLIWWLFKNIKNRLVI